MIVRIGNIDFNVLANANKKFSQFKADCNQLGLKDEKIIKEHWIELKKHFPKKETKERAE